MQEVREKPSFGDWFEGLSTERRQRLLRQHGSHEAYGGGQLRDKGGGPKKGDQHDSGSARAREQIRLKYEAGEYD